MIKRIINDIIIEEARNEAMSIIELSNGKEKYDFINYYNDKKHNICCLLIDTIKDRLIGEGKMEKGGHFGNLSEKIN